MTTIIGGAKGQNDEVEYTRQKMIQAAKQVAKKSKCHKCGGGKLNTAVLHEFGDPYIPSSIHFHCPTCDHSEPFMVRPIEDAARYAKYIYDNSGGPKTKQEKTDAMINDMMKQAKKTKHTKKMEDEQEVVDDKDNKIIAGPEDLLND